MPSAIIGVRRAVCGLRPVAGGAAVNVCKASMRQARRRGRGGTHRSAPQCPPSVALARSLVVRLEPVDRLFKTLAHRRELEVRPQALELVVARRLLELPVRLEQKEGVRPRVNKTKPGKNT